MTNRWVILIDYLSSKAVRGCLPSVDNGTILVSTRVKTDNAIDVESERRKFLNSAYERYREALIGYVRTIFRGSNEEAADIVQTVFTRLSALERPQEIQDPGSYLYRAARNVVVDSLRRHSNEIGLIAGDDSTLEPPDHLSPERMVLSQEDLSQLQQKLAKLPAKRREVFILIRVYGKSYDSVAKQLGISLSAVQRHMARALDDCRKLFDGFPPAIRSGYKENKKTGRSNLPESNTDKEAGNGQEAE